MDALMAALVAGLLATVPDRAALLLAASPRPGRATAVMAAVAVVMAATSVALGIVIAPRLAPAARQLMLAVALGFLGIEFLFRRLPETPRGPVVTAMIGSGLWFVVLTLAMRSSLPWLAVPGAIMGMMVPLAWASVLGSEWRRLPLAAIRRIVGALFAITAAVLACGAIGIV